MRATFGAARRHKGAVACCRYRSRRSASVAGTPVRALRHGARRWYRSRSCHRTRDRTSPRRRRPPAPHSRGSSIRGRVAMATILIVDDDTALREGLAETVAELGHRPLSVASGREALTRLEREAVDAVLLDLHLPDMDGIEVLRRLHENPKRPPVVILTAFASAANTIEAMR